MVTAAYGTAGTGVRVLLVMSAPGGNRHVVSVLGGRGYAVDVSESIEDASGRLNRAAYDLVLVEEPLDGRSARDLILEIVRTSPFTCCGLITDRTPGEVHRTMESLGIVGHVGRNADPEAVEALLDHFEAVRSASGLAPR